MIKISSSVEFIFLIVPYNFASCRYSILNRQDDTAFGIKVVHANCFASLEDRSFTIRMDHFFNCCISNKNSIKMHKLFKKTRLHLMFYTCMYRKLTNLFFRDHLLLILGNISGLVIQKWYTRIIYSFKIDSTSYNFVAFLFPM